MKTRKKTVKTPTKGRRRSSVIVVKKSPIRRNQKRKLKVPNKYSILSNYESPLIALKNQDASKPSSSTKAECMAEMQQPTIQKCEQTLKKEEIVNNNIYEQNDSTLNASDESTHLSQSAKRNVNPFADSYNKSNIKKRKLKKSPLSRMNESMNLHELSESIIILDDSISDPIAKLNEIENKEKITDMSDCDFGGDSNCNPDAPKFTEETRSAEPSIHTVIPDVDSINDQLEASESVSSVRENDLQTEKNTEEIVEIDGNDTVSEMEAYHNAFNQSKDSSQETCPNFADSVIVIDADDDDLNSSNAKAIPAKRTSNLKKPLEDCFVVWSSLPQPSPSTSKAKIGTPTFRTNPLYNANLDILKCDKIWLDTNADFNNLEILNNANKSKKNQLKSPRNAVQKKKQLLKGKTPVKIPARGTPKSANKTNDSFFGRAASKAAAKGPLKVATRASTKAVTKSSVKKKTPVKTVKKKNKASGELIFSSESKDGTDNNTANKKSMKGKLREIVIDGSNAAMAYTQNKIFSEKGIKLLIDYFKKRGHSIKVFVPQTRRSRNLPLLEKWHNDGIVVFTPGRKIGNKFITSYDDRFILEYATACDGIVVSQDQFRDLYEEKPQYRDTIENRLLVPTFVGDYVMFPEDPLGRNGPTLNNFLKH